VLPASGRVQLCTLLLFINPETRSSNMKIKTKVRGGGRDCGGGSVIWI
jgi:hypothetical protein